MVPQTRRISAGSSTVQTLIHLPDPRTASMNAFTLSGCGVGRGFFKTSEAAAEDKAHFVGGAVALLGDLHFSLVALFGRSFHF